MVPQCRDRQHAARDCEHAAAAGRAPPEGSLPAVQATGELELTAAQDDEPGGDEPQGPVVGQRGTCRADQCQDQVDKSPHGGGPVLREHVGVLLSSAWRGAGGRAGLPLVHVTGCRLGCPAGTSPAAGHEQIPRGSQEDQQ